MLASVIFILRLPCEAVLKQGICKVADHADGSSRQAPGARVRNLAALLRKPVRTERGQDSTSADAAQRGEMARVFDRLDGPLAASRTAATSPE